MADDEGDHEPGVSAAANLTAGIARVEAALASLKKTLAEGDIETLGAEAAAAAAKLYREGEQFVAQNEAVAKAKTELRGSIRRNPLAAIGLAFLAGLLIALLTRG